MGRFLLLFFGAAGIVLAALVYFLAIQIQGALKFLVLIPEASIVIFGLLLGVSALEIGAITFALRKLARQLPPVLLGAIAMGYVAFASVYAFGYALLAADARGIQILAALGVVRWFTLFFVRV